MPAVATAGGVPTRLGKYEILSALAAGGMARIYIARTTGIGSFERHVVLKVITPERERDVTAVQMFLDEARLAAALNHQNVAQVFEVGEDAGIHYLAMEYVHGQDLRSLLAKAGSQGTRVPLELALTTVAGAASGLNHAHERRGPDGVPLGIVHRDVSPSNIMIGYDGSVKLLDFGIAKATARSVETQSGIIKGKFAYMAPEQCRGRDVDRRSDVFSLGIILYEISTQHRCFRADSDFDTMHRIVTGDVVRPTRIVQGYPAQLEAIVMKALAVDANQRYQSAGLLLEAIESYASQARMSLSTMALGRFMREMFGDQPEPWLNASGRLAAMLQPKESTISNTAGGASRSSPDSTGTASLGPRPPGPTLELAAQDGPAQGGAALALPRDSGLGGDDGDAEPESPDAAEWNAKSYPAVQQPFVQAALHGPSGGHVPPPVVAPPPMAMAMPMPMPVPPPIHGQVMQGHASMPPPPLQRADSGPMARISPLPSPQGTGPLPPSPHGSGPQQNPFASSGSASGSAPAHHAANPYGHVPTASRAEIAAYLGAVDPGELQLKPNRRPLVIGGVIVAIALIAFVAFSGRGGSKQPAAPAAPEESKVVEPAGLPPSDAGAALAGDPDDAPAKPALGSEPPSATAGKPPAGDPPATASDPDQPTTTANDPVDVAKDPPATAKDPVKVAKDPVKVARDPAKTAKQPVTSTAKDAAKDPVKVKPPRQPKCQPPGSANPFDSRPICASK